jgi:hypothetical protein
MTITRLISTPATAGSGRSWLEGRLSPGVLGLVTERAALHREELRQDWCLARQQATLRTIAPLE